MTARLDTRHVDASAAGISCGWTSHGQPKSYYWSYSKPVLRTSRVSFARENRNAQGCTVISTRLF